MSTGQLRWIRLLARPVNFKEGMSALGVFTVECPNANFIPAKVVLKRYADKPLKNKRIVAASKAFS